MKRHVACDEKSPSINFDGEIFLPKSVGNEIFGRLKFVINRRRKIRLALENFYERGGRLVTDLIDALKHEVAKQKNSKNVVTNSCTIYLNKADCHRLSAVRLIRKLCETVERKIIPKQHRADLQSFLTLPTPEGGGIPNSTTVAPRLRLT